MSVPLRIPTYWHLPLLVGTDGRRLAKRHGDSRLASYRAAGVSADAMLRRLAAWCGIEDVANVTTARDLLARFDVARVPREPMAVDADFRSFS
jgi:glutamyl-tRNA synthetase